MPAAVILALIAAGGARAAVVTVGSPLTAPPSGTSVCNPSCIWANQTLTEPGANVTSPVTGVIVRWHTAGPYVGGPFRLRVLSPAPGGGPPYTANGTSNPETPSGSAVQTFQTHLPIEAGDLIGLDELVGSEIARAFPVTGSTTFAWNPALTDGEVGPPNAGPFASFELLFNAEVATPPDNTFSLEHLTRNRRRGFATLTAMVPGPGELAVSGNGVKPHSGGTAAGSVPVRVAAMGSKRDKLNRSGKVRLSVDVTYTPTADLPGAPNTQTVRVKLVKRS